MRCLLMFLLVSIVLARKCSDTISGLECCKSGSKPYACLSFKIEKENPECRCEANDYTGVGDLDDANLVYCKWNGYYPIYEPKSGNTRVKACEGYDRGYYHMQSSDGPCTYIEEAEPNDYDEIDYPPRTKHRAYWPDKTPGYCQLKRDDQLVPQEDFYKVLYTCWVFDCEPRLRKPKETLSEEWKKLNGNNWCWPPIVHLDFYDKYIPLYGVDEDKYMNSDVENGKKGFIYPPFCDEKAFRENGTKVIDSEFFMYPLSRDPDAKARGEVDKSFCEIMCPEENNTGYWRGERCRYIPSCGQVDLFDVGKCLPWCSFDAKLPSPDDYKRWGRKDNCNNRPICTAMGRKLAARFSEENPLNSDYCIPPRCCNAGETPDTHYCSATVTPEPLLPNATEPGIVPSEASANGSDTVSGKFAGLLILAFLLATLWRS